VPSQPGEARAEPLTTIDERAADTRAAVLSDAEETAAILALFPRIRDYMSSCARELTLIRAETEDRTRVVDEEMSGVPSPITLHPDWDSVDEMITSVIVSTPAGATNVTLVLGTRTFPVAAGTVVLAPLRMYLSKTDQRTLTWGGGGNGALELMGWAVGDAG